MAELTTRERLQPSLLDRLTDRNPGASQEGRDDRVLSVSQIKAAVLRDLGWLLNTACHSASASLDEFPEVEKSVFNFGMPSLSGLTASTMNATQLEEAVIAAIHRYEPRILPHTLSVQVRLHSDGYGPNTLTFEIQGDLWAQPVPEALYVRTQVDLETGRFAIEER